VKISQKVLGATFLTHTVVPLVYTQTRHRSFSSRSDIQGGSKKVS